jgi:tetrapyrrole methylase family protein/MazG family protein
MQTKYNFGDLLAIMEKLRGENGCPWDRVQTSQSLKRYMIEETYEVLDAIDSGDGKKIADEMGDLLLQIVFHAQIGKESGEYTIDDVTTAICEKMIRRHPHIFAGTVADTPEKVLENWDEIKKEEKGQKTVTETLKDILPSLPALMRAQKVQAKAAKTGFDHESFTDALKKVYEESSELEERYNNGESTLEELGDLLFAVVNVSRFVKQNPEEALTKAVEKFIKRFEYIENDAIRRGRDIRELSPDEMDRLWNEAKREKL